MKSKIFLALIATTYLTNCAPLAVTGAATAGYVAAQDRSAGTVLDDNVLLSTLRYRLTSDPQKRFTHVEVVDVYEKHAVLTGTVNSEAAKIDAIRTAWNVDGITQVTSSIKVDGSDHNSNSFWTDSAITASIKAKLVMTSGVSAGNYSIDTINGVVYVMGIANTPAEKDRVESVIKHVKNVRKVESYIRVKGSVLGNK